MSAPQQVPFLRRLLSARRAPRVADPADYGTAFGLELSLEPSRSEFDSGPPVPPPVEHAGWFDRWRRS
jgi:hypothetical protein